MRETRLKLFIKTQQFKPCKANERRMQSEFSISINEIAKDVDFLGTLYAVSKNGEHKIKIISAITKIDDILTQLHQEINED